MFNMKPSNFRYSSFQKYLQLYPINGGQNVIFGGQRDAPFPLLFTENL